MRELLSHECSAASIQCVSRIAVSQGPHCNIEQ